MEVTGKVKFIGNDYQVTPTFKSRELVVATNEQYPQFISVKFVQDKCDVLNGYKVGDNVTVSINLRGREWVNPQGETKYFNDIQGWKISKAEASETQPFETVTEVIGMEDPNNPLPF